MTMEQTVKAGAAGLAGGTRVGKYEIVDQLGHGGQAIVYKARDRMLDRFVAIKHIPAQFAVDPKFVERFTKEAQILAKLGAEEPAIVMIHDLIEEERGLFIVMEYLAGHDLEQVIADTKGPSEVKATLQVLWRLAGALHAVHSAGIIHRDLKPSNIIVCEGLRVKITDFGVAASITGQTSMVLGTTKYMAPELFEGGRKVDGRADMYSLGFIIYEMLGGRPKFNEIFADIVRDKHSEALRWMKWHGNVGVEAPPLCEVNPAAPRPLSDIVMRMIQKDPDRRYESMEALGRAMRMAFSPRKGGASPAGTGRRVARPTRAASAGLSAMAEPDSLVERDEGDELEVAGVGAAATVQGAGASESGGPATAPLPKTRWGRKVLLYVALPLVALALVGGTVALVLTLNQIKRDREKFAQSAAGIHGKAEADYQDGLRTHDRAKFQSALDGYKKVVERFWGSDEAYRASVRTSQAAAYLAVADQKWEDSAGSAAKADGRCAAVQRDRPELTPWVRQVRGELRDFDAYYRDTRAFREAMARAKGAMEVRQFEEARTGLAADLRGVKLIPQYEEEARALTKLIDLTELRQQLASHIAKGDDLFSRVKLVEAEDAYQKAQALLQDPKGAALPATEKNDMARSLREKLAKLTSDLTRQAAESALGEARKGGDKQALLEAIRSLNRIKPEQALQEEMVAIGSALAFERGMTLKGEGKLPEARAAFEESISLKDNAEAKAQIGMLEKARLRADLAGAGDAAFAAGSWEDAVAKFEEAGKMEMDETLQSKITECRYRILMAKAQGLRDSKKPEEAKAAYAEAKKVKPSAAALVDSILEQMSADEKYERLMAAGNESLSKNQWGKARGEYVKAQEVRDTAEVRKAILETRYGEHFSRGKEAFDQGDYRGALGYFNLAKGFKDTPEVRAMIAQTQEKSK
jgi:tRNA A-37 threonylcarbamoyl transferase component Bud32/tetratricopeptide (TPR) repeat protein